MAKQTQHRRNYRILSLCVLGGLMFLTGCQFFLRTQEQLKGANPARDLVAASVLSLLQKEPAQNFSIEGVRLGDPRSRVVALWGKPSREQEGRATWGNEDGEPLMSVLWGRMVGAKPSAGGFVRQIDLFPAIAKRLHPDNRVLLSPKILENTFRKRLFLTMAISRHTRLAKRFLYVRRGWGVVIFSELLPSQKKIPYVIRLFLVPRAPSTRR